MNWISVKEKLPDTDQFVLCDNRGNMYIGRKNWLYVTEDGLIRIPGRFGHGVTIEYWMPLPTPPGTEGGE